jgi:capsular exopolysaccharide synthesis family protein
LAARIPLLGIVPTVKINGEGGEEDLSAAHCIHQIRVSLKAQAPHDRRSSVYLVTSAAAGEGKTNLTMALGLSFAATRVRTLLIDCDLIGRQLSNTLDARDFPGLHEAIGAGTIRRRLRKAAKNLYLLPAGQVGTNDYFSVSAAKLRPLLTEARRHFDIILIDTGPILGSVEAAVLAKEVDGVLFTVARNQRRAIVERAIHRLNSLDARLEGLIFNRARSEDFESSLYSTSSTRSVRSSPQTNGHSRGPAMQQVGAFGPLVQAVAFSLPSREPAEFASKPIAS